MCFTFYNVVLFDFKYLRARYCFEGSDVWRWPGKGEIKRRERIYEGMKIWIRDLSELGQLLEVVGISSEAAMQSRVPDTCSCRATTPRC